MLEHSLRRASTCTESRRHAAMVSAGQWTEAPSAQPSASPAAQVSQVEFLFKPPLRPRQQQPQLRRLLDSAAISHVTSLSRLVPLCTTIALGSTMCLLVQHGIESQQWRTWQLDWRAQQIFRTLTSVNALASLASLGDSVSLKIVCDLSNP